jgi:hypothetical protein
LGFRWAIATPIAIANLVAFLASGFSGVVADPLGRRWWMIIPAFVGIFFAPMYLLTTIRPGFFAGVIHGQDPSYPTERRRPPEIRSIAARVLSLFRHQLWHWFLGRYDD